MKTPIKHPVRWALALLGLIALALAAAPWTVSQDAQIDAISREIAASGQARLISHGRSVFAMLPRPHIRIYDVELRDVDGAADVSASSLRVDLGLAGLFSRRLSAARIEASDATVTLDLARIHGLGLLASTGAGEVAARNARILIRRAGEEELQVFADQCDGRIDFSRAGGALSVNGACSLAGLEGLGEPVHFALWAAAADRLPAGEESPITLTAESEGFDLNLQGVAALGGRPRFHGGVAAKGDSLAAVASWFGLALPLPGRYGAFTVKGEASFENAALALSPLALSIDGNGLEGVATARFDGPRPAFAATLAGSEVNFDPMFVDAPALLSAGQWNHEIFRASSLSAADLDLRLSASRARLGELAATNLALSAILKNGRLDLSLAGASAYSGRVTARAVIAENEAGIDLRGSARLEKLDSAAVLWDMFHRQLLAGPTSATLSFETSGASFAELANRLDARGDFAVEDGELYGLDLALAFRRLERQPLSAGLELRSGRTGFTRLSAKFNVVQGLAEIEEGVIADPRFTVYFSGRAQLAERSLDVHALAERAAAEGSPLQLGFSLTGGFDDVTLAPDAQALIERSKAADFLREPKTPAASPETPTASPDAAPQGGGTDQARPTPAGPGDENGAEKGADQSGKPTPPADSPH